MNIFLMGMPGSGKSTVGKKLAAKLALEFIDLDKFIEAKFKKSIPEIFSGEGETVFREKEKQSLDEIIAGKKNYLLSLGGGTPCYHNNIEKINASGISVFIEMNAEALAKRIAQGRGDRPMFKGMTHDEILDKINSLLSEREKFYSRAKIRVAGLNADIGALTQLIAENISKEQ